MAGGAKANRVGTGFCKLATRVRLTAFEYVGICRRFGSMFHVKHRAWTRGSMPHMKAEQKIGVHCPILFTFPVIPSWGLTRRSVYRRRHRSSLCRRDVSRGTSHASHLRRHVRKPLHGNPSVGTSNLPAMPLAFMFHVEHRPPLLKRDYGEGGCSKSKSKFPSSPLRSSLSKAKCGVHRQVFHVKHRKSLA